MRMVHGGGQQDGNIQAAMNATQEILMRQNLDDISDPFLNGGGNQRQVVAAAAAAAAELHNRQESADSGLGMGSNFNLGSIPEDVSGMESMETDLDTTLSVDRAQTGAVGQTTSGDNSATAMDAADGLMPSLQVSMKV